MHGVNFHPFVGKKYYDSRYGARVMVLGESHYGDGIDDENGFTQLVIHEHAFKPGFAFFSKLTNVLRGRTDYPTEEERVEAWEHIAFYNYVQEFVGGSARIAPTPEMWEASYAPFVEVVRELKPDVILVLGYRLWDNVPALPPEYPVEWCSVIHPSSRMAYEPSMAALRKSLQKVGGTYP